MFWDILLHLFALPPRDLEMPCVTSGVVTGETGFFDNTSVVVAYDFVALVTGATITVLLLLCYLGTRTSLGPRFVRRWWIFVALAAALGFVIPLFFLGLNVWPQTHALAESCSSRPLEFAVRLPWSRIVLRGFAGLLWGPLFFSFLSLAATQTVGRIVGGGGFFHCRGCPYPRIR